jgi:hypothetical protein
MAPADKLTESSRLPPRFFDEEKSIITKKLLPSRSLPPQGITPCESPKARCSLYGSSDSAL